MPETKLVALTGNNRMRREQFKRLCKEHGGKNVQRVDNPTPKNHTKCKGTWAKITLAAT